MLKKSETSLIFYCIFTKEKKQEKPENYNIYLAGHKIYGMDEQLLT